MRVSALATSLFVMSYCAAALARPPSGKYEHFRVKTDSVPQAEIDGWFLPAGSNARGTVFLLHGYNNNKQFMVGWEWIRDREGWNVIMFDFREHGDSTRSLLPSTIGYHEIWDVKTVVDWAQRRGLRRPFVIYGRSMGAATGLRWAAMDPRISGVLAISPFKNAELATRQMADYGLRLVAADKLSLSPRYRVLLDGITQGHVESLLDRELPLTEGVRKMLREVDIPTDLRRRSDLRVWIMSGEHDSFPPGDMREMLDASASPAELKRLVIAPGMNHRTVWTFKGSGDLPSHDRYVREFLAASVGGGVGAERSWVVVVVVACAMGAGVVGVLVFVFRRRVRKS
jgi:pimeloyl-ACP methyl ester carboxylesterase